jgi:hypothetical protein
MRYESDRGPWDIRHGDRVMFLTARGDVRYGKANGLLMWESHLVVDCGGKHGTPAVVKPSRIIGVQPDRLRMKVAA